MWVGAVGAHWGCGRAGALELPASGGRWPKRVTRLAPGQTRGPFLSCWRLSVRVGSVGWVGCSVFPSPTAVVAKGASWLCPVLGTGPSLGPCAAWQALRSLGEQTPPPSPGPEAGHTHGERLSLAGHFPPAWELTPPQTRTKIGILYICRNPDVTSTSVKRPPGALLSGVSGQLSALSGPGPPAPPCWPPGPPSVAPAEAPGKPAPRRGARVQETGLPGLLEASVFGWASRRWGVPDCLC